VIGLGGRGRAVGPTPQRTLAVRGLVATVVAVVVAVLLVARGAGVLDSGVTVSVVLPPEAGRVPVNAPVYHLGVRVGDVRSSVGSPGPGHDDDNSHGRGVPGTELELLVSPEHAEGIPSDVAVRAVPRTLFGDVRLELVSPGPGGVVGSPLADGAVLPADRSEEAVLLYDVFTRASDLLVSIKPDRLQVTLTALDRALDGRGQTLGTMIDDADRAGGELMPTTEEAASAAADLALLAEDLAEASPEMVETLREATRLSRLVLDRPDSLPRLLDAGLAATGSGAVMADRTLDGTIRLVHDTGVVFDRTARNPHGVIRTLYAMGPMGRAGVEVFSSGRFDITAVPSFVDPMPYGPEDCPAYPELAGSTCGGPPAADRDAGLTVNAASEREVLRELQDAITPEPESPAPAPDTAAWTMLAPLVRGTEVTIR